MPTTGCVTPGFTQCSQPTLPEFRLFLSTRLPLHLLGPGKDFWIEPFIFSVVLMTDASVILTVTHYRYHVLLPFLERKKK